MRFHQGRSCRDQALETLTIESITPELRHGLGSFTL
jgi:hypothetical protein